MRGSETKLYANKKLCADFRTAICKTNKKSHFSPQGRTVSTAPARSATGVAGKSASNPAVCGSLPLPLVVATLRVASIPSEWSTASRCRSLRSLLSCRTASVPLSRNGVLETSTALTIRAISGLGDKASREARRKGYSVTKETLPNESGFKFRWLRDIDCNDYDYIIASCAIQYE